MNLHSYPLPLVLSPGDLQPAGSMIATCSTTVSLGVGMYRFFLTAL